MSDELNLVRRAKVIDNNDPDKKGLVKIKILPELTDVADNLLPWAKPYNIGIGSSSDTATHKIPEIGQFVLAFIRDCYWKEIFYMNADYVTGLYNYDDFATIKTSMTELGTQTYPQPNLFEEYKDGSAFFRNTNTGEAGFYNKNGSYVIFDANGNFIIKNSTGSIIELKADGSIILNPNTGKFTIKNAAVNLNSDILNTILSLLQSILVGGLVSPAGPCIPASPSTITDVITAITKLALLME